MSAIRPYEPTSMHWDTARERDVDMKLDAEACGLDSREKLWADCEDLIRRIQERFFSGRDETALRDQFAGLLDRQAAITERECREYEGELRKQHHKRIAELQTSLELRDSIIEGLRKSLDETIAERNDLAAKLEAKEQLERDSAYMRLPVDADGVPIRIGDEMEWTNSHNGEKERFTCAGYTTEYSTWTPDNLALMATNEESAEFYCDQCRHVQPDTVESLLEEFHGKLWSDDEEQMAMLEEYAERIRRAVENG